MVFMVIPLASRRKHRQYRHPKGKSRISHQEIHLDPHDEDKVLLFTAGMVFGVGASATLFSDAYWYGGLVAVALAVVLLLIEKRQPV